MPIHFFCFYGPISTRRHTFCRHSSLTRDLYQRWKLSLSECRKCFQVFFGGKRDKNRQRKENELKLDKQLQNVTQAVKFEVIDSLLKEDARGTKRQKR